MKRRLVRTTVLVLIGVILLELLLRAAGAGYLLLKEYPKRDYTDGTYRILSLGESTTEAGGTHSWPAQLERILNDRSEENLWFEVVNKGLSGTTTAFILAGLEENLDRYNPDMVITMMGANDEKISVRPGGVFRLRFVPAPGDLRIYRLYLLLESALESIIEPEDEVVGGEQGVDEGGAVQPVRLGHEYVRQGRFDEAEELFEGIIESHPDDGEAYAALGQLYHLQGRTQEATGVLERAIELEPLNYGAHYELGWIHEAQNRLEEAVSAFARAAELKPDDDWVHTQLGVVYRRKGMSEEAETAFRKAVELNPDNHMAYEQLVLTIYQDKGESSEEIELFYAQRGFAITAIEDTPSSERYHFSQLHNILKNRGIRHVAVQYPTRGVDDLKRMFSEDDGVIFVSNEETFQKALEEGSYEDYFIDRSYGDFGHATPKGNRLIAENVADAVIAELGMDT